LEDIGDSINMVDLTDAPQFTHLSVFLIRSVENTQQCRCVVTVVVPLYDG